MTVMAGTVNQAFYGSFFHTPVYGAFEYLENALIEVDDAGVIARVLKNDDRDQPAVLEAHRAQGTLVELGEPSRFRGRARACASVAAGGACA